MQHKNLNIPQSKKAETQLLKLAALKSEIKTTEALHALEESNLRKQHEKVENKIYRKMSTVYTALQKVCTHGEVQIEEDFNYHKREEWTITTCTICGKQLSRV